MALGSLTPTTELEAVNSLLRSVGLSHVNSLDSTGIPKVDIAVTVLHETSRHIQSEGWWFNTEEEVTLPLDINNEIIISDNVLSLDVDSALVEGVQRGTRLYDLENRTYVWEEAPTLNQVIFLDYEELPEVFREYIKVAATFEYQSTTAPDEIVQRITADKVGKAYLRVEQEDDDQSCRNFLKNNTSRLSSAIRNRTFNPR